MITRSLFKISKFVAFGLFALALAHRNTFVLHCFDMLQFYVLHIEGSYSKALGS